MTKTEIYKKVKQILQLRRDNANAVAEGNLALVRQNKNFLQLERREKLLNFEIGKLKFEGENFSKQSEEIEQIKIKKEAELSKIGLCLNDLKPKFSCKKCNDTGVYDNAVCGCATQLANDLMMKECGIDLGEVPTLKNYNFDFFTDKSELNFAKKCLVTLQSYVENFENLKIKNIVMCGGCGTGKTYLSKCIAKDIIACGHTALFVSSFDLNNIFLREHLSSSQNDGSFENLMDQDCLIIDDLGTEPIRKNVTKEYLLLLLNERLLKNRATIITTNLGPDQILDRYEERIFSRIFDKRNVLTLSFNGENHRLKKKN